jgi:hypothetical protein
VPLNRLPDFFRKPYVKIINDTAIVDWVHVEKDPRSFFTDTINISKRDGNKWQGRISSIVKVENDFYVECIYPYLPSDPEKNLIRVKIQLNNEEYKNCEKNKNLAFLHLEGSDFNTTNQYNSKASERWAVRLRLEKKYEISEKTSTLTHVEFLKEYGKFKEELEKELLLLK